MCVTHGYRHRHALALSLGVCLHVRVVLFVTASFFFFFLCALSNLNVDPMPLALARVILRDKRPFLSARASEKQRVWKAGKSRLKKGVHCCDCFVGRRDRHTDTHRHTQTQTHTQTHIHTRTHRHTQRHTHCHTDSPSLTMPSMRRLPATRPSARRDGGMRSSGTQPRFTRITSLMGQ